MCLEKPQIEPNDEDACGYFFFPYAVAEEINKKFGFFWVSDFDIEWEPQSYAANRNDFPNLDYSQVRIKPLNHRIFRESQCDFTLCLQIITSTTKAYLPSYPDALPFFPPEDDYSVASGNRFFAASESPSGNNPSLVANPTNPKHRQQQRRRRVVRST